jgi:hypothetical protein
MVRCLKGWDVIELPNIPQGGAAEEFLRAATEDGFPSHRRECMHSPCICLSDWVGTDDPANVAVSAHLRKNLRNTLRKVEKDGGFEVRRSDRFDPVLLRRLNELEASGWKGELGSPIFLREKDRVFWHEVSAAAQEFGYLSVYSMAWKGQVMAVSVCFNYKKRVFGMKMGWAQELKPYSPGHLLVREILRDCPRQGIAMVHLMGERSAWKEQWTRTLLPHATYYIFSERPYGKAVIGGVIALHIEGDGRGRRSVKRPLHLLKIIDRAYCDHRRTGGSPSRPRRERRLQLLRKNVAGKIPQAGRRRHRQRESPSSERQ